MGSLNLLSPLIMGGAGFSYQLTSKPETLPVTDIVKSAFDLGIRAIDTSPYYEPSEQLLGAALNNPKITEAYKRSDYIILTKVGRIKEDHLDYSPGWVRQSVARSCERFKTSYLDVVFCHDVELVSAEEAIQAIRTLFELVDAGQVRYVGISGYRINVLIDIASKFQQQHGRAIDVVQVWAQLTLQNSQLEEHGFSSFRAAGVKVICCSSPLAVGLLRSGGVPIGALGDWHPAPEGLREQAKRAADFVEQQGEDLASLALRYAMIRAQRNSTPDMLATTITGIGSVSDLEQNVQTAVAALGVPDLHTYHDRSRTNDQLVSPAIYNHDLEKTDALLCQQVRDILGPWVDYDF